MTLEEANKYADEMDKLNDEREEFIKKLTRVRCSDKHREFIEWLLTEETPCDTCEYEEGSIYCKEHCPHEAKIEKKSSDDTISRKITTAFLSGLISDETERKKALQYINELPSVNPQPCEECEYKLRGEVEQKTGYWEKATDKYCYWYKCSCCGTKTPKNEWGNDYFSPYCPTCGAKMVESQENEVNNG